MSGPIRFIHKNGHVIPIGAAVAGAARKYGALHEVTKASAASVAGSVAEKHIKSQKGTFKVNKSLDVLGLGTAIASGVVGAATASMGAKTAIAGYAASHVIDAAGIGINAASVAGKGHAKARTKQFAKQEARNLAIGNAIYLGGLLGIRKNRQAVAAGATKALGIARKFLRV